MQYCGGIRHVPAADLGYYSAWRTCGQTLYAPAYRAKPRASDRRSHRERVCGHTLAPTVNGRRGREPYHTMESRPVWHWVLMVVLALIAFSVIRSLVVFVWHTFFFLLQIAVIAAVIWGIYALITRKKAY